MANPNSTVAAARNRKTVLVYQQGFNTQQDAEVFAKEYKQNNETHTVKVTSYKYGSFQKPCRGYTVRCYEKQ